MDTTYNPLLARRKRDARVEAWLNPAGPDGQPLEFESPEAQLNYKTSITRFMDTLTLEQLPDRVPVMAFGTFVQTHVYGVSAREALYDYDKLFSTHQRFLEEFRPDYYGSPAFVGSGRVFETLDVRNYRWPGHGVPDGSPYQCVEGEYMKAEEYSALIEDPSGFWLRSYLPRIFGALEPLSALTPPPQIWEIVGYSGSMIPFGLPPVQRALKALMAAGDEALSWIQRVAAFDTAAKRKGFATVIGGASKAPYDILADTLRGTQGMMLDLYRRPEMVLKATERLVPLYVQQGVEMATMASNPVVFVPLHKGADAFLSDRHFATFYWPTLKALLIGLINEGCIPMVFCEGSFDSRLQYLDEIPPGTTFWLFDRTDMSEVKRRLGKRHCIGGNVPAGLLLTGTPDDVRAYCRDLIDRLAPGGGYILCNGTAMDEGNAANVHAMIDFGREYGVYRR